MNSEWKVQSLREAGVSLIDCEHRTPPPAGTGYPYIAIPQLKEGHVDLSEVRLITRKHFLEWTRKAKPQYYDVILSRRCNPGESAAVPEGLECAVGQNLVLLRANGSKVFPPFLRWLLRGNEWWEQVGKFLNVGAVFDSLKCADIPNFRLPIPPLAEQRAITEILAALDDKIELNRRMNETLESMAGALFKSWFIYFDPVRAKAEGRDSGLPKHLADLFPESFEDSTLAEIPRMWEMSRVADIGKVICGMTPSTMVSEYYGSDVPFITIPDMHGKIFAITTQKQLSHAGAASQPKKMLPVGAICVSCIATPGLVVITSEEAQTNQQINTVVPRSTDESYFWFWSFRHLGDEIRAGGSGGSVVTNLSTGRFAELRILTPPTSLRSSYHSLVTPFFGRILANEHETNTLRALRDALLPKLISGALPIKVAERIIRERV